MISKTVLTMVVAAGAMAFSMGQANAQGASRVTHKVNCDKGNQKIQPALDRAAGGDIIEIRGTCNENIRINKSVTLQGVDGAEIIGVSASSDTIQVRRSRARIRDLTISGGRRGISVIASASADVRNTDITNGNSGGILVTQASYAVIQGGSVTADKGGGGNNAITVRQASGVDLKGVTVTSINRTGIIIIEGGSVDIDGSIISGRRGIFVSRTSSMRLSGNPGAPPNGVANDISGTGSTSSTAAVFCGRFSTISVQADQTISGGTVITTGQCSVSNLDGFDF